MQPTLFTATYTADRAAEPHVRHTAPRLRLPRKTLAAALAAIVVGAGLVGAADAPGSAAPDTRHLGAATPLVTAGAITARGQFGWQARCRHTVPAKG